MNRSEIKKIGGSNIASILGQNPYESAHSLYLQLTGELPPKEENDAMRWGKELESEVAKDFAADHPEYEIEPHGMVTHPDYDFLIASPDRILLQNGKPVGVLEIKTTDVGTRNQFVEFTDNIPFHFLCQLTWYLGMMKLSFGYVAVRFRQSGRRAPAGHSEHPVKFAPDLFDFMVSQAVEFWNTHVIPRIPPEMTKPDAATVEYYRRRERDKDKSIYSDDAIENEIKRLRRWKALEKRVEEGRKFSEVKL